MQHDYDTAHSPIIHVNQFTMAQLLPNFGFTGSLKNVSAYKMRGVDKMILRTKGGPSKSMVKNSDKFELVRLNNAEFGGCSTAGKWTRQILAPLRSMANYNISGYINALFKHAQALDTEHNWGQRSVLLSKNPRLLEGFNFNKGVTFDAIIRNPVSARLYRDSLSARLDIPALVPGINFHIPANYAAFSLVAVLGIIPDFHFNGRIYSEPEGYIRNERIYKESDWFPCSTGSPAAIWDLQLPVTLPDDGFSLVLGIGIQFGTAGLNNSFEQVKHTGAAKIIAMA